MAEVDYKSRCEQYEKLLGIGASDPVKNAFFVLVKMLNQQSEYLGDFKIKSHIESNDKEAPQYKRAMDMFDSLPKMIAAVNDLRTTLKLTKEDLLEYKTDKPVFSKITTPESIAQQIGDYKAQDV